MNIETNVIKKIKKNGKIVKIVKSSKNKINTNKTNINPIEKYLNSLNDKEKIALNIAKDHLGSSFDIERCIGFQEFLKSKNV